MDSSHTQNLSNNRVEWIDAARGIALIFVLLGHSSLPAVFANLIYTFHIPLFFFLSGFVFSAGKWKNIRDLFKYKCNKMIIPYFSLGFVLISVYFFRFAADVRRDDLIIYLLKGLIIQERFEVIWFLTCLFLTEIIFYGLIKILKNRYDYLIIAMLISAVIGYFYFTFAAVPLPWNADICFMVIPFFGTGYLLKNQNIPIVKYCRPWIIIIMASANILFGCLNSSISGETIDLVGFSIGNFFLYYIAAFTGIFAVALSCIILPKCRLLNFLGRNTLIYFAWHSGIAFPLIYTLYDSLHWFQANNFWNNLMNGILTVVLTILLLTPIHLAIQKSPLCFMIGRRRIIKDE